MFQLRPGLAGLRQNSSRDIDDFPVMTRPQAVQDKPTPPSPADLSRPLPLRAESMFAGNWSSRFR
eukprot:1156521-Pelagomonas_calceolata.AAC.15